MRDDFFYFLNIVGRIRNTEFQGFHIHNAFTAAKCFPVVIVHNKCQCFIHVFFRESHFTQPVGGNGKAAHYNITPATIQLLDKIIAVYFYKFQRDIQLPSQLMHHVNIEAHQVSGVHSPASDLPGDRGANHRVIVVELGS